MKCIDEPYEIFGDYNADVAANVQAVFVKCDPSTQTACASEQEIEDWLKSKYIVTLANVQQYRQSEPDPEERVEKFSLVNYFAIDPRIRVDFPRKVHKTEL